MLGLRMNARWQKGFALGAISLLAVVGLRSLTQPFIGSQASLLFFMVPVLIAAYYGGLVPGLTLTVVSAAVGVGLFLVPYHAFGTEGKMGELRLSVFIAQGILVSFLSEELHRSRARAERMADDLRESEERFRLLVDATADYAMYGLDDEGRFNSWNAGAERLTGYSTDEVIGREFAILDGPENLGTDRASEQLRIAREEGECRAQGQRVRRDGSRYWAEMTITAIRNKEGMVRGFVVVSQDISEQREIELVMRDQLARTRAILDAAADAILTFDAAGTIESVNPAAERVFRQEGAAFAGQNVRALLPGIGEEGELAADEIRMRLEKGRETIGHRRDGTNFPTEVSVSEMELAGRRLCACFVRDVTMRKEAEEQIRQLNERLEQRVAERTKQLEEVNEELKAFTYTVSHDLRAPLRSMQRFAQVVLSEDPEVTTEEKEDAARRTLASAARMERLIQDLLEYSRLTRQEFKPQRVSLILVVQEVIGQLERDPAYRDKARVLVREPLPIVMGHRAILVRVFTNLLTNAMKYVPQGKSPCVQVWGEERGSVVRVWVEDNGVGIDAKYQEELFEPFRGEDREENMGLSGGLGLAIVRKGAERLGGRLGLESEIGRGSRFWVELMKG